MVTEVLFVGGGVIGLSGAWRSAERGLKVTVVDPAPGHGASWAAAGMLAPVTEAAFGEERLVRLLVAAAARWPSFAAELADAAGTDVGYRTTDTLLVAIDAGDRALIDNLIGLQASLGLTSIRLSASECRRHEAALSPSIRGGALAPDDHQVDNRLLVGALLAACERAGVEIVEEATASIEIRPGGGGVTGVRLGSGRALPATTVVLAAGADSPLVAGLPARAVLPVRPVKGHTLRLAGGEGLLHSTVRGLVHGRPCYLVPRRDGSIVVGATAEERGYDRTVRAGAVRELLDDARTLVPGIEELELSECSVGLRPGSPDNCPFVGWSGVGGLAVATGHYRNGILLAPVTADAVASLVSGEEITGPLAGFAPGRVLR